MVGQRVCILRGKHHGQAGEIIGLAENVTGIKKPVYCVWLGGTDAALCCADEMEVVPCWPDACPQQESR